MEDSSSPVTERRSFRVPHVACWIKHHLRGVSTWHRLPESVIEHASFSSVCKFVSTGWKTKASSRRTHKRRPGGAPCRAPALLAQDGRGAGPGCSGARERPGCGVAVPESASVDEAVSGAAGRRRPGFPQPFVAAGAWALCWCISSAVFPVCGHRSYQVRPTLMTSFYLDHLCKDPVSTCSRTGRAGVFRLQCAFLGVPHNTAQSRQFQLRGGRGHRSGGPSSYVPCPFGGIRFCTTLPLKVAGLDQ